MMAVQQELAVLGAEQRELEARITVARRRQLLRLRPVRGRVAQVGYLSRRVIQRFGPLRSAAPGAAAQPVPSAVSPGADPALNARDREAMLGEARGRLVVLRGELERAEQDLRVPARRVVKVRTQAARDAVAGRIVGRRARSRRPTAPRVSVLTAVYETDPHQLRCQLASVAHQTFSDLEHILVDDGSPSLRAHRVLTRGARRDKRRQVVHRQHNGGIVAASADALALACGEFVALVDHDDLLAPTALAEMVAALEANPHAVLAYSDHDLLTVDGRLVSPLLKPDFSPERLRSHNYITHLMVARRDAVVAVGGFREGYDGAQDHDLALRLSEVGGVLHVPRVLYHWRQAQGSVAADPTAKSYAYEAGRRAVDDHCRRTGIDAEVRLGDRLGEYVVERRLAVPPRVSVVIPTRGSSLEVWGSERVLVTQAIASMVGSYPDLEFVVVTDTATPEPVRDQLRSYAAEGLKVVEFADAFNFSAKCNRGAAAASGEVLLFLNDDTELIEPRSIERMVALLSDHTVGAVGAKLLFADGRLQHVGHVYAGGVDHALIGWPGSTEGPWRMAVVVRECPGVTAAALAIRRTVFDEVGGFDEAFPVNFNDVDLCLRIRDTGRRILVTPRASWYHFESATREGAQTDDEVALLNARWAGRLADDEYFHPLLQPGRSDFLPRPLHSGLPPDTYPRRRRSGK